ncbi:sulfatase family protein [Hyphococcus luteus]|uniref:Twin-arginine translocation pathway signal protein n=1 Tax=Hyphococcus luteus TaxID=2058213 RepID=A0A2S7K5G6_9PROT|nr:sulfatase-like hydrolase/transferase [Marinicaulis flavus]PQA87688.1 twin-arginine translocation pathway signal protein [Marinicaulis flavus]
MHNWNRRAVLAGGAAIGAASISPAANAKQQGGEKPNILFIMADDLGYADLSCYGRTDFETPAIDALASDGLQLMQTYANSAVCSATRTALITGRYQYRLPFGLQEPGGRNLGLPPDHPTLPSLLKKSGYKTALIGKWHMGAPPEYGPLKSGYDSFYGIYGGGTDYFRHSPDNTVSENYAEQTVLIDQDAPALDEGYLTDLLADRAINIIEDSAKSDTPFFVSLHFTSPHWPWIGPNDEQVSETLTDLNHEDGGNIRIFASMVKSMDANIERVLHALKRAGLDQNTIVVFTSDNGGERYSDVWPFVGVKGELLEGGIRVPGIVRWPGHIKKNRRSEQVITSMDWMPTLLAAAGAQQDPGFPSDGENLLDQLTGQAPAVERKLCWRFKANEQSAIRDGDWKYLKIGGFEHLFNLAEDERERADLKDKEPERFAQLKTAYQEWDATMLPYPEDSYSHDVKKGNYSDRY